MSTIAAAPAARSHEHLVLDFLAYLEFERGLSRNTLEAYRSDLLQFGRFLESRGLSAVDVEARDVSDFLTGLAVGSGGDGVAEPNGSGGDVAAIRPASPATVHRKAACLRSFFRHLRREDVRQSDPTSSLSAPRRGRKLPQVLTRGEVERLLSRPRGTDPSALRDRALLELMYACGLRASEAIGLEVADVDLEDRVLRARGKGSKERIVPIGGTAVGAWSHLGLPQPSDPRGGQTGLFDS